MYVSIYLYIFIYIIIIVRVCVLCYLCVVCTHYTRINRYIPTETRTIVGLLWRELNVYRTRRYCILIHAEELVIHHRQTPLLPPHHQHVVPYSLIIHARRHHVSYANKRKENHVYIFNFLDVWWWFYCFSYYIFFLFLLFFRLLIVHDIINYD